MSVGDIKGSRRRFSERRRQGLAPKPSGRTAAQMIEINRIRAANAAKAAKKR